ncbi:MAG: PepSY-like domain-containing protein [Bacteroidales bacterium]|jgi:hypothetical protein|nr:PepSY-like domain-containing protein [Bacteroidales bacterium]
MKIRVQIICAVLLAALFFGCEDRIVPSQKLPAKSQTFLKSHFSDATINQVIKDNDGSYTVFLANGFQVEFKRNGEWDDVDGKMQPIPESVLNLIPQSIYAYIVSSFSQVFINEVSKEWYGYEIGLSNDLDLEFRKDGTLRNLDD